jgi:hypothetical protein
LRLQHVSFCFENLRQFVLNVIQRILGLSQVAALVPDFRQEKPGAIADFGLDIVSEESFEYLGRVQMVPIGKVKAAEQKFRFFGVTFELRLLLGGK